MTQDIVVIIPAAGMGTRFGGAVPKQFQQLGGKPIVQRIVERFMLDERVLKVVVPVAEPLLAVVKQEEGERVLFVAGGETRQQSVTRGLEHAGPCAIVAIHDAVRPFFSYEVFHAVVDAAREHGAALPVIPLADTIHVVEDGAIAGTPDRKRLFAAQTPQAFRPDILEDVLRRAAREGADATDEAGLAAGYGHVVRTVPGDSLNFKITRPEDLALAERVIAEWGDRE